MHEVLWAIEHIWSLANNSEQLDNWILQLNIHQKRWVESDLALGMACVWIENITLVLGQA